MFDRWDLRLKFPKDSKLICPMFLTGFNIDVVFLLSFLELTSDMILFWVLFLLLSFSLDFFSVFVKNESLADWWRQLSCFSAARGHMWGERREPGSLKTSSWKDVEMLKKVFRGYRGRWTENWLVDRTWRDDGSPSPYYAYIPRKRKHNAAAARSIATGH